MAHSAHRQAVQESSPTTDTSLHEAVMPHMFGAGCHIREAAVHRNSLPISNLEKCGVPNGTRQTTEQTLNFFIDLTVEAA